MSESENERKLIAFVDCEAIRNYQINHQINKHKKIHKTLHIDITWHKNTPFITAKIGCPNKTSENIIKTDTYNKDLNLFERLKETLSQFNQPLDNDYKLPFTGGALGYFGYDLGRQLETLPEIGKLKFPLIVCGKFRQSSGLKFKLISPSLLTHSLQISST